MPLSQMQFKVGRIPDRGTPGFAKLAPAANILSVKNLGPLCVHHDSNPAFVEAGPPGQSIQTRHPGERHTQGLGKTQCGSNPNPYAGEGSRPDTCCHEIHVGQSPSRAVKEILDGAQEPNRVGFLGIQPELSDNHPASKQGNAAARR